MQTTSAPWELSANPPGSLQWKMGPGEDYLDKWLTAYLKLSAVEREELLVRTNAPKTWRRMLSRFVKAFGP
jgi:hypothetical protein